MNLRLIDTFTNECCEENADFRERVGNFCHRSSVVWTRSDWANFIAACDALILTLEFQQSSGEFAQEIARAREVRHFALLQYLEFFNETRRRSEVEASDALPRPKSTPSPESPPPPLKAHPLPSANPAPSDGPNMAWPAAPMSAPSSDVLDPSPSLADKDRASNEISGGMGGLIESARLAPPLPTAAQERADAGLRGEAEEAIKAEARQVARTLVVTSGEDCIGIGSYESGIVTIVQLDADGVKRRARTAESWVAYIADALYKFATRPRPAPQPATGDVREAAERMLALLDRGFIPPEDLDQEAAQAWNDAIRECAQSSAATALRAALASAPAPSLESPPLPFANPTPS